MPADIHERLRALAGESGDRLDELNAAAWACNDPIELEICRLRVADMLGDQRGLSRRTPAAVAAGLTEDTIAALPTWWTTDTFTPRQRARIAFTEQFVMSVTSVSDADVDALLTDDDALTVYQFVTAIYVMDLTTRVDMVTRSVFGPALVPGDSFAEEELS